MKEVQQAPAVVERYDAQVGFRIPRSKHYADSIAASTGQIVLVLLVDLVELVNRGSSLRSILFQENLVQDAAELRALLDLIEHAAPGALRNHGSGHRLTGSRVALAVAI